MKFERLLPGHLHRAGSATSNRIRRSRSAESKCPARADSHTRSPAFVRQCRPTTITLLKLSSAALLFLAPLAAGTGSATELRDAELVAGGSSKLQNGSGTVVIEDSRLGRLGPPAFVPEPGALWQLGSGIGLLALLVRRQRPRAAPPTGKGSMT